MVMKKVDGTSAYEKVTGYLLSSGCKFEVIEHEPFTSTEEAAQFAGVELRQGAKSLLLRSVGNFVLAVIPSDKQLDSKKMKRELGTQRLSFASPEELFDNTSCMPGTCHPFGNVNSIPTYVDKTVSHNDTIAFNAGLYTKTIMMAYADYQNIVQPYQVDIVRLSP